ncbi:hypothetical protein ACP70R_031634 [Stipagrostis hirtigluma subsp. patula]
MAAARRGTASWCGGGRGGTARDARRRRAAAALCPPRSGADRSSIDSSSFLGRSSRSPASSSVSSGSLQEVTRLWNKWYKKGNYAEALRYYDRAVALCRESAACRGNRAAAFIGLGRLVEALRECEEAVRFDPASGRAHSRLGGLSLR